MQPVHNAKEKCSRARVGQYKGYALVSQTRQATLMHSVEILVVAFSCQMLLKQGRKSTVITISI